MKTSVAVLVLVGAMTVSHVAFAQKEAMGMMYEIQMAPKVCGWTGVADGKKLDATIASQEKAMGVSASEKATFMKTAEADLKADPTACEKGGMMWSMYGEAAK